MKETDSDFIPGGLSLSEQSVHLLRRSGAPALVEYYIGSLPFTLGLLYFWSDMSRNPMAYTYCGPSSAGLALLFIWMKYWQVRFCRRLTCLLQDAAPESWPLSRSLATMARQCALHATGMALLPLAGLIVLPMGWIYAFYQNVTVLDGPESKGLVQLGRSATRQSLLWPAQNHLFLSVISVFATLVLINLGITLITLPNLLKSLLGVETVFTLSAWSMLNTTFFAALCILCYLCVDPIIKAGYVLRCFHGVSLQTGDDIRAGLKPYLKAVLPVLVLAVGLGTSLVRAQDAPAPVFTPRQTVTDIRGYSHQLDEAIDQVLQKRRFAWRLPREKVAQETDEPGWLASLFNWIGDGFETLYQTVKDWIGKCIEWLENLLPEPKPKQLNSGTDWRGLHKVVFYVTGLVLAVLLVLMMRRWRRMRQPSVRDTGKHAAPQVIDLSDENVSAQDLPTDRWLRLAVELMENGDYRSALRAFYLSVISVLADGNRLAPARHKSNQDYYRELAQRAHAEPEVLQVFHRCLISFERAWYGMHPVSRDQLDRFVNDQERINALVQSSL